MHCILRPVGAPNFCGSTARLFRKTSIWQVKKDLSSELLEFIELLQSSENIISEALTMKKRKPRPAITTHERIQNRDFKLWEREKEHAIASNKNLLKCQCTVCMGACFRTILSVERHLKKNGRYSKSRIGNGSLDIDSSDEDWEASIIDHTTARVNGRLFAYDGGPRNAGGERLFACDDVLQSSDAAFNAASNVGYRPTGHDFTRHDSTAHASNNIAGSGVHAQATAGCETRFGEMIFDMFRAMDDAVDEDAFQEESPNANTSEDIAEENIPTDVPVNDIHVETQPFAGFAEVLKPLYAGAKQTILEFTLLLVNLCTEHRVPQVFTNAMLSLLKKKVLPQPNACPPNWYHAKELIKRMGLNYENIDACSHGCILFRKEHAHLLQCPKCKAARYKGDTNIPVNRVRWFPLIPRLLRMYRCPSISKLLTWSSEHKTGGEMVHHVADSKQWKLIDELYPNFAKEPRNVRFGLMLDGVNPFQLQSVKHSMWPIMLVNYNLPPWLTTKRFFVMLCILISGKKSITQDNVDVYLEPLYEELLELWGPGVDAFDCHARNGGNVFKLRGILMWTINDYPALGYISGLCTGGNRSCIVCGGAGPAERANCLKKSVHFNHRRWLPLDHIWRTEAFANQFNGLSEDRSAPPRQSAAHIQEKGKEKQQWDQDNDGKKNAGDDPYSVHGVKRCSALFKLPYWEHLPVRHCIDVMHMEKNVCESLLGFLLGIKDTKAVRDDMESRGIRPDLWAEELNGRQKIHLPQAPYTFTEVERDIFMNRLKRIKAPDGYCGNWDAKVELGISGRHHKLFGLKSHDYHVLMQQVLRICIRGLLAKDIRQSILALSRVFERLCQKELDPALYDELRKDTVETLCRLEMTLPPAFFDVMTHLLLHAVEELEWCGPVHTRWMYFGERALAHFTRFSQTRANVGGSIAACYVREEALGYITEYMTDMDAYRQRVWDENEEPEVIGEVLKGKATPVTLTEMELHDLHTYVLENFAEMQPWRIAFDNMQQEGQINTDIRFSDWVQIEVDKHYMEHPNADTDLLCISRPPPMKALSYKHMWAYGSHYRVKDDLEQSRATYDSGVAGYFEAPIMAGSDEMVQVEYIGELTHILQLLYKTKNPIILLKARWVRPQDPSRHPSLKVDDDGLLHANFKQLLPENVDPYVFPRDVHQVFFLEHESPTSGWRTVMKADPRGKQIFDKIQEEETQD